MQELGNKFSVGDKVTTSAVSDLVGAIGIVRRVGEYHCEIDFGDEYFGCWTIQKRQLAHTNGNRNATHEKQVSIERLGDKTSVTISGHLTKDDVQSILNLIF